MRQLKNNLLSKQWFRWILVDIVVLAVTYYVSNNWYQLMLVQGESMSPALHDKQLVILERHNLKFTYGDIIAFQCEGLSSVLVKRIAACPGDIVVIEDGTLFVNGEVSILYSDRNVFEYSGILSNPVQLDKGQYIVIGDNIAESKDSRYQEVGYISEADIWGKVVCAKIAKKIY